MYCRLIKPDWAKPLIRKQENPDFVREIQGKNVIEGEFSPEELKELNEIGYNVYFFPNTFDHKDPDKMFLSGKDITKFQYVFIDMDLKDGVYESKEHFIETVNQFSVTPTMIVDSGNGVHVYWQIDDLNRELFMIFQMRLIQQFKTDHSVWTPLQLMRFPGYFNTKDPENYKLADFVLDTDEFVDAGALHDALPPLSEDNEKKIQDHLDKLNGIASILSEVEADLEELPDKFVDILESKSSKYKHVQDLFNDPVGVCGDRSTADFKLANVLWRHYDFNYSELMQVMCNSKKALSRNGNSKIDYAAAIVYRAVHDNPDEKYDIASISERKRMGEIKESGKPVLGPQFWDYPLLHNPWRRGQVLGMIAAPGVGKTTATLKMMKDILLNDKTKREIAVFFTLEMPDYEIIERWDKLTVGEPELSDRLFVVSNEDPEGNPRHINLQDIVGFTNAIKRKTGQEVSTIAIDHIGVLNPEVDLSVEPNFGVQGEPGRGSKRYLGIETICAKTKEVAKLLDVFLIIQSQTTKEKAGGGDVPLGTNAAFGTARFEWYMDYVLTFWQPLYRVQNEAPLTALAYQYGKIRAKHSQDQIKTYEPKVLYYDMDNGDLRTVTDKELQDVNYWTKIAQTKRSEEKEDKNTPDFKPLNLRKINELLDK